MDSTLPAVVYDRETRKAGGTNADDITRIVSDLPITTLKETTSLMWQRDEQVLRLNPDVIVMHFSAFYDETSPDHGDHRLENFLTYMSASKANFLIYSRMTDAQRRWLDGWLNGVISRTPALRGRIEILRLRLFNQSHDVRERGTLAGARHRHAEGAGAVVGAGDDLRAIDLWHWTRFAGDLRAGRTSKPSVSSEAHHVAVQSDEGLTGAAISRACEKRQLG